MPKYKLHYFCITGRAEPIRMLLQAAEADYEDVIILLTKWRNNMKNRIPTGHLPMLEIDEDKLLFETTAIMSYLGRKLNMAGSDEFEAAAADACLSIMEEAYNSAKAFIFQSNKAFKADILRNFEREKLPLCYHKIRAIKKLYGRSENHLVGDGLTFADIAFFGYLDMVKVQGVNLFIPDDLRGVYENVLNIQPIKEYLQERYVMVFPRN